MYGPMIKYFTVVSGTSTSVGTLCMRMVIQTDDDQPQLFMETSSNENTMIHGLMRYLVHLSDPLHQCLVQFGRMIAQRVWADYPHR